MKTPIILADSQPTLPPLVGYWNQYPKDKPEEEGWYLVWHGGGPEASGYLAGFAQAYYTPKRDDWEAADPNSAIEDGCLVTHWAYVKQPNETKPATPNMKSETFKHCDIYTPTGMHW